MKKNVIGGLIAIVVIVSIVAFSGCIEEKTPAPIHPPSVTPIVTPKSTPETPIKESPNIPGLRSLRVVKEYNYYSGELWRVKIQARADRSVIFKFVNADTYGQIPRMPSDVRAKAEEEAKKPWRGKFKNSEEWWKGGSDHREKYFLIMIMMIDENENIAYSGVFTITKDKLPVSERGLIESKTIYKSIDLPLNTFSSPYSSIPQGTPPKIYDVNVTSAGGTYWGSSYRITWKTDKPTIGKVGEKYCSKYSDTFSKRHSVKVSCSDPVTYPIPFKIKVEDEDGRCSEICYEHK